MVSYDRQETKEIIRQQYLADRSVDMVAQDTQAALHAYYQQYDNFSPEDQIQEAERLYKVGSSIGGTLFRKASVDFPENPMLALSTSGEIRFLRIPSLGSFLVEEGGSDEPSYSIKTYTNVGLMGGEDDLVAYVGADWRDAVQTGGVAILSRLRWNTDKFEAIGTEVGIPKVQPVTLVK
jgi:hypothetical protein